MSILRGPESRLFKKPAACHDGLSTRGQNSCFRDNLTSTHLMPPKWARRFSPAGQSARLPCDPASQVIYLSLSKGELMPYGPLCLRPAGGRPAGAQRGRSRCAPRALPRLRLRACRPRGVARGPLRAPHRCPQGRSPRAAQRCPADKSSTPMLSIGKLVAGGGGLLPLHGGRGSRGVLKRSRRVTGHLARGWDRRSRPGRAGPVSPEASAAIVAGSSTLAGRSRSSRNLE
jgi:hypothetical protein